MLLGALVCICLVVAVPLTFGLLYIITTPTVEPEPVTQTGEPYYMELACGDGEHFPYVAPRLEAATSDAVVLNDIEERKARIMAKPAPKVIRSLKDREAPKQDHTLEILG
jgi:hypothetical protein